MVGWLAREGERGQAGLIGNGGDPGGSRENVQSRCISAAEVYSDAVLRGSLGVVEADNRSCCLGIWTFGEVEQM